MYLDKKKNSFLLFTILEVWAEIMVHSWTFIVSVPLNRFNLFILQIHLNFYILFPTFRTWLPFSHFIQNPPSTSFLLVHFPAIPTLYPCIQISVPLFPTGIRPSSCLYNPSLILAQCICSFFSLHESAPPDVFMNGIV